MMFVIFSLHLCWPLVMNTQHSCCFFFFLNKNPASAKDPNPAVGWSEGVEFKLFIQVLEKNACYFFFFFLLGFNNQNVKICS